MANRFWVASAGTYSGNINDTAHWSTTSGGAGGSALPTNADDVFVDGVGSSGGDKTITLNVNQPWRSFDMTGGGVAGVIISHTAAVIITVGAASSTGFKMEAGGTYTAAATSAAFTFTSSGSVFKNITTAGYTLGSLNIANNASAFWQLADTLTVAFLTPGGGSFKTQGNIVNITSSFNSNSAATRAIDITNSTINHTGTGSSVWLLTTTTGLTWTATGSTLNFTANGNRTLAWGGSALAYGSVFITGTGIITATGVGVSFVNYSHVITAGQTTSAQLATGFTFTVTGTLTLNGNSVANRLGFLASTTGNTITAAAVALSYVDFEGITGAGAAAPFTGTSLSDCTGNSNITFASPRTLYLVMGASDANYSSAAVWSLSSNGAGGQAPPLCQDTAVADNSSTAGPLQTLTWDLQRYGNQNFSAANTTSSPLNRWTGNKDIYGDQSLAPDFTNLQFDTGGGLNWSHIVGTKTMTSNGCHSGTGISVICPGATLQLGDDFSLHSALGLTSGTFDANGHNILIRSTFTSTGTLTRVIAFGSGQWQLVDTCIWTVSGSGITFTGSGLIGVGGGAGNNTFAGGGFTYGTLYKSPPWARLDDGLLMNATTKSLTITGANTFGTLKADSALAASTITLPASTTQTITTLLQIKGVSGKLISLISSSAGTPATVSSAGRVDCDYMSLKDSTATGGATFYEGTHTTEVSGVTGWTAQDAPAVANTNRPGGFGRLRLGAMRLG